MSGWCVSRPKPRRGSRYTDAARRHSTCLAYARHMGEFVRLEVDGGVGTIRLDRPKMNALDAQMQRELLEVAREADTRADVAAVVLYGGERVFAAGADVKEMADMTFEVMA